MMQCEFEKRFGMRVHPEVYSRIEVLYTNSTDDKDAFVRKLKQRGTAIRIQNDIIYEQNQKLQQIERFLKMIKKNADETYERIQPKAQAAREKLIEGSGDYYAYNNYISSLHESVLCGHALDILNKNK